MAGAAGQAPVEGLPSAAVEFGGGAIEQDRFGGRVVQAREIEAGPRRGRLSRRETPGTAWRFVAVKLHHVERRDARDGSSMRCRRFVDEHADAPDAAG